MYSAILLSGGKGKRMKKEIPKQYLLLEGKPIIMHSLERLDRIDKINEIIVVCEEEYRAGIELMIKQYNIETHVEFAPAGEERQESVFNGIKKVKNENVIIHEAARPFVTENDYMRLINAENPNAFLGYSIPFTVVKGGECVTGTLNRNELVNVQLPQKFETSLLKEVHEKARADKKIFTEDAGMVFEYTKKRVEIIEGTAYNIKITEPVDLLIGEIIYKEYIAGRK